MKPDRFARLKEILLAVADLGEAECAAYLDEACKDDPDLRREVESTLAHDGDSTGIMKTAGAASPSGAAPSSHPDRIGPYKILEPIGEGGMGVVYLAEQTEPVRRHVALKVIKLGMDTKQVVARFESERQALALMDHPAIAKVLDAGTTPEGRPYFAMEYVKGVPITEYCDTRRLGTQERLELFQHVCEGVQHAHQKAVLHRDLKPSNILVADMEGKPQPRIIDFGVAKATTQKLTEKTMYTTLGQLIGTPEYMSPEQADLTVEDIDTRTDVYSLGVILYELLSGALPFDSTQLRQAGFEGIIRLLREKDPLRPSTKVSSLGERTTEIAQRRRTEPRRLAGQLKGDLDWIVMRSLEKDRNRRYGSPQELVQDIQRHLNDEPVMAGPPSAVYRARKFIRRNRVGVGVAAAMGIAVVLAFILVSVQNARIATARDEAELVTATLEEMLASVDPTKSGRDVTVKEMLDETAKTLGERFRDQPLVEARLRHTVGKTYDALGEYESATDHLEKAVEIREEILGAGDPETIETTTDLGRTYMNRSRYDEAEALLKEALENSRGILGNEHRQTLYAMGVLGMVYNERGGRRTEAHALLREALEISGRVLGEEHSKTVDCMNALGISYRASGRFDEAEALLKEALEISFRTVGENHPITLKVMTNLASNHRQQGNLDEAEKLLREILETKRRVLGSEHRATLYAMSGLARTYSEQGRYEEAAALFRECLEIRRRIFGEEARVTLDTMIQLAGTYGMQGRHDLAEPLVREALEVTLRVRGEDHGSWNTQRYDLACIAALGGRRDEAISLLRAALNAGYDGPSNWYGRGMSILEDPDLASLHGDPEFEAIVEELKRRNEDNEQATVEERRSEGSQ